MSNESGITIITPRSLSEAKELASTLAGARTIPEALQKSPADVLAIVMAGAELGLAPMQSVRALVLIKGKPTLSADAMGALVKSRRDVCQFLMLKHSDGQRATYETQRVGDPSPTVMSFTIEEAKQAGLNGDNWRKFPAAMLRARALSAICRAVYPDLLLGVYDPDELEPQRPVAEREVNAAPVVVEPPPASPPVVAEVVAAKASPPPRKHAFVDAEAALPPSADPLMTEVAALGVAVAVASNEAELNALVGRIAALPAQDKAKLRAAWGARRDELRGGAK